MNTMSSYKFIVIGTSKNDNKLNDEVIDYCKDITEAKAIKDVNDALGWFAVHIYDIKQVE